MPVLQLWLEVKTDLTLLLEPTITTQQPSPVVFQNQICWARWNQFELCKLVILVIRLTQDPLGSKIKVNRQGTRGVRIKFCSPIKITFNTRYHSEYAQGYTMVNRLRTQIDHPLNMDYQGFRAIVQSVSGQLVPLSSTKPFRWKILTH